MKMTAPREERAITGQVRRACARVDRRQFVPPAWQGQAADDVPLPIGYGQTTTQPSLIARMIQLLELRASERVLEIGTGSGYQTAILAELAGVEVFSVEIVPALAAEVAERLKRLGYDRVRLKQGDGHLGWAEYAPYDGILVSAAYRRVPTPLRAQLAEEGRMVIPLGKLGMWQILWRFVKRNGKLVGQAVEPVVFVPRTRTAPKSPL
jgi:protein-L-isoaspartate(D-aspartate) O-methyltransferase